MTQKTIRFLATAILGLATASALPAQKVAGATYDMVSSTVSPSVTGGAPSSLIITYRGATSSTGSTRFEVVAIDGTSPGSQVGDVVLATEGHVYIVHPATKTYVDLAEQMTGLFKNMPPEMLAQMTVSEITGSSENLGSSDMIDGRPGDHTKTTVSYSMNMMGQAIPISSAIDTWLVKFPIHISNPLAGLPQMTAAAGPMAEVIKKQLELMPPLKDGLVAKTVVSTTASVMGRTIVTVVTTEMKNIKQGDVDASTMKLPDGYTKSDK